MNLVDRPERPLASSAQAQVLLDTLYIIDDLPVSRPTSSLEIRACNIDTPDDVAVHFPDPDPLAQAVEYGVRIDLPRRLFSRLDEPDLYLANVYFRQAEIIDTSTDLGYIARIGYHIRRSDQQLKWERRLVMAETGVAARTVASKGMRQTLSADRLPDLKVLLTDLKEREKTTRKCEEQLGLNAVYMGEAAEVISFCRELISPRS